MLLYSHSHVSLMFLCVVVLGAPGHDTRPSQEEEVLKRFTVAAGVCAAASGTLPPFMLAAIRCSLSRASLSTLFSDCRLWGRTNLGHCSVISFPDEEEKSEIGIGFEILMD